MQSEKTYFLSETGKKKSNAIVAAIPYENVEFLFGYMDRSGNENKKNKTRKKAYDWNEKTIMKLLHAEFKNERVPEWMQFPYTEWHLPRVYIVLFYGTSFFTHCMHFNGLVDKIVVCDIAQNMTNLIKFKQNTKWYGAFFVCFVATIARLCNTLNTDSFTFHKNLVWNLKRRN